LRSCQECKNLTDGVCTVKGKTPPDAYAEKCKSYIEQVVEVKACPFIYDAEWCLRVDDQDMYEWRPRTKCENCDWRDA